MHSVFYERLSENRQTVLNVAGKTVPKSRAAVANELSPTVTMCDERTSTSPEVDDRKRPRVGMSVAYCSRQVLRRSTVQT